MTYTAKLKQHDDRALKQFMMQDPARFLYLLGDLVPPYHRLSRFAVAENGEGTATVALLFKDGERSALLAGGDPLGLLAALKVLKLPKKIAFQLTLKEVDVMSAHYEVDWANPHHRMILTRPPEAPEPLNGELRRLGLGDLAAVQDLARRVPEIWFTETQYRLNPFIGLFDGEDQLVAMGGFHVLAPEMGVAALGSIGVHPACRRQGYGRRVVAALLGLALESGAHDLVIGLNVARENPAAVALYESVGFEIAYDFQAGLARLRLEAD